MKIPGFSLVFFALAALSSHAEEIYLAVGAGGQRMFAKDGLGWENHVAWGIPKHDENDLVVTTFFKGAAYGGGGYSVARLTATRDGKAWSEGVLPNGAPVFGLEVLNHTLYAVTLRGQIFKTTDGEIWTMVGAAEMPTKTHWIRGTASGNGILIGSGDFGPALAFDPKTEKITVTQIVGQTEKFGTAKRVAFGNGVFVVGGQDGVLAVTQDGINWRNNVVHPERGFISSVVWTGTGFLASTEKKLTWASKDGLEWHAYESEAPKMMVRAGDWIYGWGQDKWYSSKVQRSRDGAKWEAVANAKEYTFHYIAKGDLAGSGTPPKQPEGKVPQARIKPTP